MSQDHYTTPFILDVLKIVAPIVAVWIAYLYAVKKLKAENRQSIERKKYEAILRAHERCWSLIAYLTEVENANSIFVWVRENKVDTYYFRPDCFRAFFEALNTVYYEEGNGLYLSKEVFDHLFYCRNVLYGIALKTKTDEKVKIENNEMVKAFFKRTEEMRSDIRNAIQLETRKLEMK